MTITTAPLTRREYDLLVDAGALDGQPVELLDGRKVLMPPESALHAATIEAIADQIRPAAAHRGLSVRVAHPIALSEIDEPEPDIALVTARGDRYATGHPQPTDVRLIVEVAGTSAAKDLGAKAARYAAAGIDDYWVIDLNRAHAVIHRQPATTESIYSDVRHVTSGAAIAPLALPRTRIEIVIP